MLITILAVESGSFAQISLGPQTNYDNAIMITNNTQPNLTNYNVASGTYGVFLLSYQTFAGPCINAGAIKTFSVTSGHGGTGYAVQDLFTVNGGGSPAYGNGTAYGRVTAVSSGVVTAISLLNSSGVYPINAILTQPYGAGYSVATGAGTKVSTGSGDGTLEVNINSIYAGTAGPNCSIVESTLQTAAYASTPNQSITFTSISPAPSAINGTYTTAFEVLMPQVSCPSPPVTTPPGAAQGSGQTDGMYIVNAVGGGGSGAQYALTISGGVLTHWTNMWYGFGYTSAPTVTISAGGIPATVTCTLGGAPSWALDTSISPNSPYYLLVQSNDSGGVVLDNSGNLWALTIFPYPNLLTNSGYIALKKSTDNGVTWSGYNPIAYDGAPGAMLSSLGCGPGANSAPCYYVSGNFALSPDGYLTIAYWVSAQTSNFWVAGTSTYSTKCCYLIKCNPSSADCTNVTNWTAPAQIAPALSPAGYSLGYTFVMVSSTDSRWWSGDMANGMTDAQNHIYLYVSCDNGATWGSGTGCTHGEQTIIQIQDIPDGYSSLPTGEYAVACIANCATPPTSTLVLFNRNNYQAFTQTGLLSITSSTGGAVSGTAGQTCGVSAVNNGCQQAFITATLTAANTISGATWQIAPWYGDACTAAPTTANLSNGSATCSGTATITSTIGPTPYCIYPQTICGPTVFGYSLNGGSTWKLAQSNLHPFAGPFISGGGYKSGLWGQSGMYLTKAPVAPFWTVWWLERDELATGGLYIIASTINPLNLIANLSSWTNNQLQSLWYYNVNDLPSSVWASPTAAHNGVSFNLNGYPATTGEAGGWWSSYGTYVFTGGPSTISGFIKKGFSVQ